MGNNVPTSGDIEGPGGEFPTILYVKRSLDQLQKFKLKLVF